MSKRNESVIALTLTELLALLFFVLALALTFEAFRRSEAQEVAGVLRAVDEPRREAVARMLEQAKEDFPEDFQELVRRAEVIERVRDQLRERLSDEGVDSMFTDTASVEELADSLLARHAAAKEINEALREAQDSDQSTQELIEQWARERAELQSEASNLQGQLAFLRERVGDGLDHPPCWADSLGKPEYALRTTLFENSVATAAAWPSHRSEEAEEVTGLTELAGRTLSYQQFRRNAAPVLDWSKRQQPECRHFVVVMDSVGGEEAKEAFKDGLLTVEHFFYKYLAN